MTFISHGDKHPTAGVLKEQRKTFLQKVVSDARKAGKEWCQSHPKPEYRDVLEAANVYSAPYMMDDVRADKMHEHFLTGVQQTLGEDFFKEIARKSINNANMKEVLFDVESDQDEY